MQLSRASEFYPGSPEGQDRILLVSGTVNQLLTALHLVLSKLKAEPGALRAVQVCNVADTTAGPPAARAAGRELRPVDLGLQFGQGCLQLWQAVLQDSPA